jgi:hypothetical protein
VASCTSLILNLESVLTSAKQPRQLAPYPRNKVNLERASDSWGASVLFADEMRARA